MQMQIGASSRASAHGPLISTYSTRLDHHSDVAQKPKPTSTLSCAKPTTQAARIEQLQFRDSKEEQGAQRDAQVAARHHANRLAQQR